MVLFFPFLCFAALVTACHGEVPSPPGSGNIVIKTPICDPADPGQVVAPQRIVLLTSTQLLNMIRLVNNDVAQVIVDSGVFPVITDLTVRFPPTRAEFYKSILDQETLTPFVNTAQMVGDYVRDNFATVTGCSSAATDACATAYLGSLARKAYRRNLTTEEQDRFVALYASLRNQIVNEQQVTLTMQEATGFVVQALLLSPQTLWRWEIGGDTSTSPPGVYLTDAELASNLSFFLTDRPPDDALITDTITGALRAHLGAHVDRLLGTQTARDWLTHIMETYFRLNQLAAANLIDPVVYPDVSGAWLYADLQEESHLFLADAMWNGKVTDLLSSRKTFLNTALASTIYRVPAPAGATGTNFVETTLPADQRAGLLTNAGFLVTRSRPTSVGLVARALGVKAMFTCIDTAGPEDASIGTLADAINAAVSLLPTQTAQEQVALRAGMPECASCHATFDPYGLALDSYDIAGRYRTVDDLGKPVDPHTKLPAEIGGGQVQSAVELADVLSRSEVFTNCMARAALQYATIDAAIELPLPTHGQAGCAVAGVANQLRQSGNQSFTDLMRATATSPAFVVRQVQP